MFHASHPLQNFIAVAVVTAIIAPTPVWDALNYGGLVPPPQALIFIILVRPADVGATTLGCVSLLAGVFVGGLCSAVTKASAYAANGDSVTATVTRGAVFTVLFSFFAACLNGPRWIWDAIDLGFLVAGAALVFAGGMSTYYAPFYAWEAGFYVLALAAMAGVACILVSWLVMPVHNGDRFRRLVSSAMHSFADAVAAVEELAMAPPDPEALAPAGTRFKAALQSSRTSLAATIPLRLAVLAELDLRRPPRRFPRAAFTQLKVFAWDLAAMLNVLAQPLLSGSLKLRLLQQEPLRGRFLGVTGGLQRVLRTLGDLIVGTAAFAAVDAELAVLDAAWMDALDAAHDAVIGCSAGMDGEVFAVRILFGFLSSVGAHVRSLFASLPAAIKARDPAAPGIAAHRFVECPGWVKSADAFEAQLYESKAALQRMRQSSRVSRGGGDSGADEWAEMRLAAQLRQVVSGSHSGVTDTAASAPAVFNVAHSLRGSAVYASRRLWNLPSWVMFGLQASGAKCCVLHACIEFNFCGGGVSHFPFCFFLPLSAVRAGSGHCCWALCGAGHRH